MSTLVELLEAVRSGHRPSDGEAVSLADTRREELTLLMDVAAELRDAHHGRVVTYSRKVFLPLTHLCRDTCGYCVFAEPPKRGENDAYMSKERVLLEARCAVDAGCKEALFTLGDKPELRYDVARKQLRVLGHDTTLSYLKEIAELVQRELGLFPHLNPGTLTEADVRALRPVSVSMGLMLESTSERLLEKGGPHHACPDKAPARRIETARIAGELSVPFTTGILIGIGETRRERIDSLLAIRDLAERHGHIQEVIIQNFRRKPGTRMADALEPDLDELLHTIAVARIVLGPRMNIQAPPNLSPGVLVNLLRSGINDWGGVSPVTPDFVNPEAPWPHLEALARETEAAGKVLVERLAVYPAYALDADRWLEEPIAVSVRRAIDAEGYARVDRWSAGDAIDPPVVRRSSAGASRAIQAILDRASRGSDLDENDIVRLFTARGSDEEAVTCAADELRRQVSGDEVTYVVNRNINYTNVCYFKCRFCAFSKGKLSENLRGKPYVLELQEIAARSEEAWARGATEVCLQGGIHPEYTGQTYIDICRAVKEAAPDIHVHAFSPLEIRQGAETLGVSIEELLRRLKDAGLSTLPGTAAEVLDDEVRAQICPDKLNTEEWLRVMETAHRLRIPSTATIMFGHVDHPRHWARHLLRLRELQKRTSGFTELVPLPFVHMESPMHLRGVSRRGPTFREAILMHAVARLALYPHFVNIQTSWVKMGPRGALAALDAGANDLGGTLMNESITRAAGALHGQELGPVAMEALIRGLGPQRPPRQRTTKYGRPLDERVQASRRAGPLRPLGS
jgi:FO synthase